MPVSKLSRFHQWIPFVWRNFPPEIYLKYFRESAPSVSSEDMFGSNSSQAAKVRSSNRKKLSYRFFLNQPIIAQYSGIVFRIRILLSYCWFSKQLQYLALFRFRCKLNIYPTHYTVQQNKAAIQSTEIRRKKNQNIFTWVGECMENNK